MTETEELTPDDELGQLEALDPPDIEAEEADYVEDPDYDPANDELDPELMSEGVGETGLEVPSEGGDI